MSKTCLGHARRLAGFTTTTDRARPPRLIPPRKGEGTASCCLKGANKQALPRKAEGTGCGCLKGTNKNETGFSGAEQR
jgi:hypothetical protein